MHKTHGKPASLHALQNLFEPESRARKRDGNIVGSRIKGFRDFRMALFQVEAAMKQFTVTFGKPEQGFPKQVRALDISESAVVKRDIRTVLGFKTAFPTIVMGKIPRNSRKVCGKGRLAPPISKPAEVVFPEVKHQALKHLVGFVGREIQITNQNRVEELLIPGNKLLDRAVLARKNASDETRVVFERHRPVTLSLLRRHHTGPMALMDPLS